MADLSPTCVENPFSSCPLRIMRSTSDLEGFWGFIISWIYRGRLASWYARLKLIQSATECSSTLIRFSMLVDYWLLIDFDWSRSAERSVDLFIDSPTKPLAIVSVIRPFRAGMNFNPNECRPHGNRLTSVFSKFAPRRPQFACPIDPVNRIQFSLGQLFINF